MEAYQKCLQYHVNGNLSISHSIFQYINCLLLVFKFSYLTEENNWIAKHEKVI